MSKQDRQGVRTPADIERKYDLGRLKNGQGSAKQEIMIAQLTQTLNQYMAQTNAKLEEVDDIIKGYFNSKNKLFYKDADFATAITGEGDKIYVDVNTKKFYSYTGTVWDEILSGEKGEKGDDGLGAYESAKLGGYKGTMTEFYTLLGTIDNINVDTTDCIYKGANEPTDTKIQYWLDTSVSPALLKYKDEYGVWNIIAGGGGGGSGDSSVEMKVTPEWTEKIIAYGNDCVLNFEWHSLDGGNSTGMGTFSLYINSAGTLVKKESYTITQGTHSVDLKNYLILGDNEVVIELTDKLGNTRKLYITITTIQLSLTKAFNDSTHYTSNTISFGCVPKGAIDMEKQLFIYLDDKLAVNRTFTSSGATITSDLTVTTHGVHSIRAYFTCQLDENEEPIKSEEIYCEFAFVEVGNTEPIIVTDCGVRTMKQFESLGVGWCVFTPNEDGTVSTYTPSVKIYEGNSSVILEGATPEQTLENVEQGVMQTYPYKAISTGTNYIIFKVGNYKRSIEIEIEQNKINVNAETEGLGLYLSSAKRSNSESVNDRSTWTYNNIVAELQNFNFTSDGWVTDESGKNTVLRHRDEATTFIPFEMFTDNIKNNGITIEFEFATSDVMDDNAEVISCMNNGIGLSVTAKQATLHSQNETISTRFRDCEQVRISFVIEPATSVSRLMLIYINGVMSGAKYYLQSDKFAQAVPQGIRIGSNLCTTDIYCIRVYNTSLERRSILNNWIADTQDVETLVQRANRNNIYDSNGLVSKDMLQETLPYLIVNAGADGSTTELPQFKGDKKTLSGQFIDNLAAERGFIFNNATWDVQGTSSSGYVRKNYKVTFKYGIILDGVQTYECTVFEGGVPTTTFCLKADVASSEGANNVELVKLFDDICPVKTPPQNEDSRIRQGIDGFPIALFRYDGTNYIFMGKYNFNNDKSTPEVFGMTDGVESWELLNNATQMGEYKDNNFNNDVWLSTWEARYPEDNLGYEKLKEMVSWVYSTWRENASDTRRLETPITYGDITYEYDSKEYRKAKFINEVGNYFNKQHLEYFYLHTSFFLMTDNREKNTFPTLYLDGLWYFLPYDFDTALGINNSGELTFEHYLEDTDMISDTEYVYNGAESVLWCNVRDYFADEIRDMYRELRSSGVLTYEDVTARFNNHQAAWGEAIFNEDAYVKYIEPLLELNDATYLPMLLGNKQAQRDYWLYYRFKYFDGKYTTGDTRSTYIRTRVNNAAPITIKPYTDTYLSISYEVEPEPVAKRALKNADPVVFEYPEGVNQPQDAVVDILNADMIADLGDLSNLQLSEFRCASATRIQSLMIGSDEEGYVNSNLRILELGNNKLLKVVNVNNCTALTQAVNLSGCSSIEEVYFENTQITTCQLPKGGSCRVLHLPETIVDLTVINHKITDFSMPNYNKLNTLWLELNEISKNTFDIKTIVNSMVERFAASEDGAKGYLRLTGFELTGNNAFDTAQEIIDFYNNIKTYFVGLNANGDSQSAVELVGKIEVKENPILGTQLEEMRTLFPNVEIIYQRVQSTIFFYHDEEMTRLFSSQTIYDNGNASDPTVTLGKKPTYYAPTSTNNNGTEDANARYVYTGWSGSLENVTTVRRVHALYRKDLKYYRSFLDKDGNYIPVNGKERNVYYAFDGENKVIEPADPENFVNEVDGISYHNNFIGWLENGSTATASKQVPDVKTGDSLDVVYIPVYDVKRVYIVKYLDETTEIGRAAYFYGDTVQAPANPTKNWDRYNTYTFSHWELENGTKITNFSDVVVTKDMNIYASFDAHTIYYKVRFRKHYGSVLQTLSTTYPYGTTYDNQYTGVTSWSYTSPKNKTETLVGWRVTPKLESGTYYLDYTASLYTEEDIALAVRNYNSGIYNTGEPKYICDGDPTTERGFNIGVIRMFQVHHYIRLDMPFAQTLPTTTVFNNVKIKLDVKKSGYKDGLSNYTCRLRTYFQHYDGSSYLAISADDYLIDDEVTGDAILNLNNTTLSQALTWMTNNISVVNDKNVVLTVSGSNVYIREVYMTMCYTT